MDRGSHFFETSQIARVCNLSNMPSPENATKFQIGLMDRGGLLLGEVTLNELRRLSQSGKPLVLDMRHQQGYTVSVNLTADEIVFWAPVVTK